MMGSYRTVVVSQMHVKVSRLVLHCCRVAIINNTNITIIIITIFIISSTLRFLLQYLYSLTCWLLVLPS